MTRAVSYGFAGGGLVVAAMALVYTNSREFFLSPVFQYSLLLLYIITIVLTLLRQPPYERGAAIRAGIVVYMIINFCFYAYTYVLYEVIDPNLYDLQSHLMIENAEKFGMGEPGSVEQSPEVLYSPENLKYTIPGMFFSYMWGALFGIALSFIIGTLLGKKEDVPPV